MEIETDLRLEERVLSREPVANWLECLQNSFTDMDVCFEGGESSHVAMERGCAALQDILSYPARITVVVTHGNLMTLLLKSFDDSIGFETWKSLRNPDVFRVVVGDKKVERVE